MSKEEKSKEKKLLLNVLKDGLPYGLKLQITDANEFTFNGELRVLSKNWCRLNIADPIKRAKVKNQTIPLNSIYIKPYLRPMSSMTKADKKFYNQFFDWYEQPLKDIVILIEWLNANHFDYRGLIPMGLALEAPEGMYGENC